MFCTCGLPSTTTSAPEEASSASALRLFPATCSAWATCRFRPHLRREWDRALRSFASTQK